ncbi:hypothetical protein [Clostridium sp.]|uniref:hypothetical protein n=1 Tax=Clostridium sp. TaxID=1506 RepID=UPI00359FB4E6
MSLAKFMDELMEVLEDCLNNFSTDELIILREKRASEDELISSPEKVKENVLYFFDTVIEASKENTKIA